MPPANNGRKRHFVLQSSSSRITKPRTHPVQDSPTIPRPDRGHQAGRGWRERSRRCPRPRCGASLLPRPPPRDFLAVLSARPANQPDCRSQEGQPQQGNHSPAVRSDRDRPDLPAAWCVLHQRADRRTVLSGHAWNTCAKSARPSICRCCGRILLSTRTKWSRPARPAPTPLLLIAECLDDDMLERLYNAVIDLGDDGAR